MTSNSQNQGLTFPTQRKLSGGAWAAILVALAALAILVGFLVHQNNQEKTRDDAEWFCALSGQGGSGSIYSEEFRNCVEANS